MSEAMIAEVAAGLTSQRAGGVLRCSAGDESAARIVGYLPFRRNRTLGAVPLGQRLGSHEIQTPFGAGGTGQYRARHTRRRSLARGDA